MAPARRDLLPECIPNQQVPLDVFAADFCSRCLNEECTRSIAGKSRFEARVASWEERLFLNPPVMAPEDPRYSKLSAQKFITIDVGRTPEIRTSASAWVDPNELSEPEPAPHPVAAPPATKIVPAASQEAWTPSAQNHTPSKRSALVPEALVLGNAPDQSGKKLQAPPSESISKRDPWAAPAPPEPTDQVVTPGATVKLRGSGV